MSLSLSRVALVVRDYDEAIAYFTTVLGFRLVEDTPVAPNKRWVMIGPPTGAGVVGANLVLARAATPEQESHIGNQTGGRVFLFLHTDDFDRDYAALVSRGVDFIEAPRAEVYGRVVVFRDLYGNKWDLVESPRPVVD
ncbi:MAG TPA: VOC family protein [Gemmatimonadaceae bacterium]|nr:VOC family protein [Gemmatimonadaceae bacterium]